MTPDDKKRVEEIREMHHSRSTTKRMLTVSPERTSDDFRFLLTRLDEAHAALRLTSTIDVGCGCCAETDNTKIFETIDKALGEE